MTRDECIEAMARAIDPDAWDADVKAYQKNVRQIGSMAAATTAYEAMQPHIQAREEAVREACAEFCFENQMGLEPHSGGQYISGPRDDYGTHAGMGYAKALRSLQIGGNDD